VLGIHRERPFAKFATQLSAVRIVEKPHSKAATGFKHVYEIEFEDLTPSDLPRLDDFCAQLLRALEAWSVDEVIELIASVPNLDKKLRHVPGGG
jgi:type VI secretion system protein ImpG